MRLNTVLVNRARELAGIREALVYRAAPGVAGLGAPDGRDSFPHLRVPGEQGWEASRKSRDEPYRDEEKK